MQFPRTVRADCDKTENRQSPNSVNHPRSSGPAEGCSDRSPLRPCASPKTSATPVLCPHFSVSTKWTGFEAQPYLLADRIFVRKIFACHRLIVNAVPLPTLP